MNLFYSLRIALLIVVVMALTVASVLFYQNGLYFSLLFSVLGIVGLMVYACYMLHHSTKLVMRMIDSIRYNDFLLSFSTKEKNTMEERLKREINQVVTDFRQKQANQEERYHYYETLLDTVDCSLIVADKDQRIHWMNKAAVYDLLGHYIHSLEELNVFNKELSGILANLPPGEVKVVKLYREDFIQDMAVTITIYNTPQKEFRLINLKNIRSVLEENELEAWQKLIHVLTHEIMNSIAPIISLSDTLSISLKNPNRDEDEDEMISQGMRVINRRSKGMQSFVTNYRKLAYLPSPTLMPIRIGDLLADIRNLYPNGPVIYTYELEDEDFVLRIDRSQIEQVLINLLKNAKEACEDQPHPEIRIATHFQADKRIFHLSVTDNGLGILPNVMERIYVPFFTTKNSGSGIGLSLCKQVMALHGGSISVSNVKPHGASFVLKFLCR